jgi:hypothetical protein
MVVNKFSGLPMTRLEWLGRPSEGVAAEDLFSSP